MATIFYHVLQVVEFLSISSGEVEFFLIVFTVLLWVFVIRFHDIVPSIYYIWGILCGVLVFHLEDVCEKLATIVDERIFSILALLENWFNTWSIQSSTIYFN